MNILRHIPALILFVVAAIFLNYFLPSRDVVQIVGTDVKRIDVRSKAWFWDRADIGTDENSTRDVRFINANWPNGKARVYRNEDTGWSFPPYFKFDSGDVNAEAQSLAKQDDQWVAVRHYGWRIKLFSIFPNATSIKRVSGPDVFLIPWFNIVFIGLLLALWLWVYLRLRRWRKARIDPIADKVGDSLGDAGRAVSEQIDESSDAARGFFKKWFGSSKKR